MGLLSYHPVVMEVSHDLALKHIETHGDLGIPPFEETFICFCRQDKP